MAAYAPASAPSSSMSIVNLKIPGLVIYYNFVDISTENDLMDYISSKSWDGDLSLKRRTQHYGYHYSFKNRNVQTPAQPIEGLLLFYKNHLTKMLNFEFDQIIVNEYLRNQGIGAHTDAPGYDEVITTLSLLDDCVMTFRNPSNSKLSPVNLYLPRRSLLVMSGVARHEWTHEISSKVKPGYIPVSDPDDPLYPNKAAFRSDGWRRVSLTTRALKK